MLSFSKIIEWIQSDALPTYIDSEIEKSINKNTFKIPNLFTLVDVIAKNLKQMGINFVTNSINLLSVWLSIFDRCIVNFTKKRQWLWHKIKKENSVKVFFLNRYKFFLYKLITQSLKIFLERKLLLDN